MKCPRCGSDKTVKNGFKHEKQCRKCKDCGYGFTIDRIRQPPADLIQRALELRSEGKTLREIGKVLNRSNVTILKWLRQGESDRDVVKTYQHCLALLHQAEEERPDLKPYSLKVGRQIEQNRSHLSALRKIEHELEVLIDTPSLPHSLRRP